MENKQVIKRCLFVFCASIIILLIFMVVLRYGEEGEKNMPYKLSKILVVSTIDGVATDDRTKYMEY